MRTYLKLLVLLGVLSIPLPVKANDGSLKIETDILSGQDKQEIFYVEEETGLADLFTEDLSRTITDQQGQENTLEQASLEKLFLEDIPSEDATSYYEKLLFTADTRFTGVSSYHIKLLTPDKDFSWPTLVAVVLGGTLTGVTLYKAISRRKGDRYDVLR